MKSSPDLGLSAMRRILRKAGAPRVSNESAEELRRAVEEVASGIARGAVDLSAHARRKTVRAEDVRMAARQVLKA